MITRRTISTLFLTSLTVLGQRRKRKDDPTKPPDVEILSFVVERREDLIHVHGTVKLHRATAIKGLKLYFEFQEPDGKTISRMNTDVADGEMRPGDEGSFLTQTPDQVRAVSVLLDAEDREGRYLRLDRPGPYVIE